MNSAIEEKTSVIEVSKFESRASKEIAGNNGVVNLGRFDEFSVDLFQVFGGFAICDFWGK